MDALAETVFGVVRVDLEAEEVLDLVSAAARRG